MHKFEVDVAYDEHMFDTIPIEADDRDQAEFEAMNVIRDSNPQAHDLDVKEIRQVG